MSVTVITRRRKPNADYASKIGDPRRKGYALPQRGTGVVAISFIDAEGRIEALLGVMPVGYVSPNPAGRGFFWAVQLPGLRQSPRPAHDADKARDALATCIRQWCEAAHLVTVKR